MASCFVNRHASFFSATSVCQTNSSLPIVNNYLDKGGYGRNRGTLLKGYFPGAVHPEDQKQINYDCFGTT